MASETILITGCSDGGIGSALALTFQQRGFQVFATARDITKMSKLKDLPNVTLLTLDITDSKTIERAVDTVAKETGGSLDFLVNNAGRNHFMPILDENIEKTKDLFNTNVWGPLAVTQAFSPLVIKAKGSFVFVTSIAGYGTTPWMGKSLSAFTATLKQSEPSTKMLQEPTQPRREQLK
jgi:1-acylglycerone phosphate reductase